MKRKSDMVDYSKVETPEGYKCSCCGASNVKLWRDSGPLASEVELLCARCASIKSGDSISNITSEGLHMGDRGITDQIGDYLPAVLTKDGKSFYQYTTVTFIAIKWWKGLPTLSFPIIEELQDE